MYSLGDPSYPSNNPLLMMCLAGGWRWDIWAGWPGGRESFATAVATTMSGKDN